MNNGKCVDGVNSVTCNCEGTGFQGDQCQDLSKYLGKLKCFNKLKLSIKWLYTKQNENYLLKFFNCYNEVNSILKFHYIIKV